MGKGRGEIEARRVTIWLPVGLIDRADGLAGMAEIERGNLLRRLIEMGIEALERSEKVGILQMSLLLGDMREALNRWVEGLKRDGWERFARHAER